MPAIDTILVDVHNATAGAIGLTAGTAATGDSLTVRNFADSQWAKLEAVSVQASGVRQARVTSPMLHDNVTGLTFSFAEEPTQFLMPREIGQALVAGDLLTFLISAAATSDSVGTLHVYYSQLGGGGARLFSWGDISGIVKSIKALEVDCTTSATIGAWSDTLITTTENQLHAHTDYAVLGFLADTAVCAVGVKGQETVNLRVCGPGPTITADQSDYFVRMSDLHNTPHIPVFNADNKGSYYVSTAANTASVSTKVTLILAELSQTLAPAS